MTNKICSILVNEKIFNVINSLFLGLYSQNNVLNCICSQAKASSYQINLFRSHY